MPLGRAAVPAGIDGIRSRTTAPNTAASCQRSERASTAPVAAGDHRRAEDEQDVRDDRAGERAADDVRQAVGDREQRDDQLGRVAEARVQEAADAGAGVLGGVLGRLADQPRERDERERGEDEQRRLVQVEHVTRDEHERREGEQCPEDPPRHDR